MNEAKVMLKKYPEPNTISNYYCDDGILGIQQLTGEVKTIIDKARFLKDTQSILGVIRKNV